MHLARQRSVLHLQLLVFPEQECTNFDALPELALHVLYVNMHVDQLFRWVVLLKLDSLGHERGAKGVLALSEEVLVELSVSKLKELCIDAA